MRIKHLFLLLLFFHIVFPIDSVFTEPMYITEYNVTYEVTTRVSQNVMCILGFFSQCEYGTTTIVKGYSNQKLYYPFRGSDLTETYFYGAYDAEDIYINARYDTADLRDCSKDADSFEQIFNCVIDFNKEFDVNCMSSTSAFKIAYLNSKLYRSADETYSLIKVFSYDNTSAHRFNMLINDNGYFVMDPLFCTSEDFESCVHTHTRIFYQDSDSVLYRGKVYKVEYY